MSFILLGILNSQAAGGAFSYWLATLGGSVFEEALGVAADSSDNFYAFGRSSSQGAGSFDFLLAKYDTLGTIQWQRVLGGADSEVGHAVTVDSSDNVYAFGYTSSTGAGSIDFLLAKYNSSGTIQWQRVLGGASVERGYSIAVDSADNLYVAGEVNSAGAGSADCFIGKYNSSGTIQWQRALGGNGFEQANGVTVDASDNVYVTGYTSSTGAGSIDFLLAKYNSSGTIQWQRVLGGASDELGVSVTTDSSGNVYAFGYTTSTGAGSRDFLLAKYNSSGTIQWQRILGGTDFDSGAAVKTDSSGNVYLAGYTNSAGAGGTDFLLAKYDSSGTIQWQRVLGGSAADIAYAITIDSLDNLNVAGRTFSTGEGSADFLLAKLPNDGSLTGTYQLDGVDIIYSTSTLTAATSTLTAATSTLTDQTLTLTAATSTLTAATSTLTDHIVGIG